MRRSRFVSVFVATSVVAGCATLPQFREDPITTADVILNIKCELREAVWLYRGNEWVQKWIAGLTFSLDVTHTGGLDADASWVFPMAQGATFSIAPVGGFSGQATRKESINFNESLEFLRDDPKLRCAPQDPDRYARLGGQIGFADLLERVGRSMDSANIRPKELSYNLDFVIKKNANVTPRFSLIAIGKEKKFTGFPKWSGSYSDTQSLKLVLTRPAEDDRDKPPACKHKLVEGKCPQPVYQVTPELEVATPKKGGRRIVGGGPAEPDTRAQARRGGAARGLSSADEERIERAQTRNLLDRIEGGLRREGIAE